MNILIINDNLILGGAEVFSLNLKKMLENDNQNNIKMMTFDKEFSNKIDKVENNQNIINILDKKTILGKINKFIFNPILYFKIRKKLKEIKPDKIILNNIFFSPITQIKALKGYDVYQVVHDYSVICPKSTCIKNDFKICKGFNKNNCIKECVYHNSKITIAIKWYMTKRMEKLRKKIVKKLISPSECLNKYLKENGYNSVCINNPINNSYVLQKSEMEDVKKYIYVGAINENKGILKFLESFIKFANNKNVIIEIVGRATNDKYEKQLEVLSQKCDKIKIIGSVPYNQVFKKLSEADFFVVPSLWMENYPTTILEAMLAKVFIIGSTRGGIPEMLADERGITFDILNEDDIIEKLDYSYNLNLSEYKRIVENSYNYVNNNNSMKMYENKFYKEVVED